MRAKSSVEATLDSFLPCGKYGMNLPASSCSIALSESASSTSSPFIRSSSDWSELALSAAERAQVLTERFDGR